MNKRNNYGNNPPPVESNYLLVFHNPPKHSGPYILHLGCIVRTIFHLLISSLSGQIYVSLTSLKIGKLRFFFNPGDLIYDNACVENFRDCDIDFFTKKKIESQSLQKEKLDAWCCNVFLAS